VSTYDRLCTPATDDIVKLITATAVCTAITGGPSANHLAQQRQQHSRPWYHQMLCKVVACVQTCNSCHVHNTTHSYKSGLI
jgi:hypothetical protein